MPLAFSDDASAGHDFYAEGTDALTLVFLSGGIMVFCSHGCNRCQHFLEFAGL